MRATDPSPSPAQASARGRPQAARHAAAVVGLVFFALALRVLLVSISYGILRDGFLFTLQAELLAAGEWAYALRCPQHPLTAALIALFKPLVGDWILTGQWLNCLSGSLVLVPLYLLTRDVLNHRAGLVAAAAAAVSPYAVRFNSHVLSDGPYWLFLVSALAAGWWALTRRRIRWFALAGLLCGLAYLTRPEGALLAPVVLIGCVVLALRRTARLRTLAGGAVFLGCFLVLFAPYAYVIGGPTLKKNLVYRLGVPAGPATADLARSAMAVAPDDDDDDAPSSGSSAREIVARHKPPPPLANRVADAIWKVFCAYTENWHQFLFALALGGLIFRRRVGWPRGATPYLLGFIGITAFSHMLLFDSQHYLARRHAVPVGFAAFPYAGAGWLFAVQWLSRRSKRPQRTRRLVTGILIAILLGSTLPKALTPRQKKKAGFRKAGRWLAAHSEPDARIMVSSHPKVGARALRAAMYAGGYPPLPYAYSRPGESLEPPANGEASVPGRLWPSRLPELWDLPSFPLAHRRRLIFAPGTRRIHKLMRSIDRGRIDFLLVDHWEIGRRFGHFARRMARDARIARARGRQPELELVFACPIRPGEENTVFIYKVNRPIRSYIEAAERKSRTTRPTEKDDDDDDTQ